NERNGKQRIHLSTEPLTGWVDVEITERRRTTEWIDRMVELADVHYPDAVCIRVVVDNLNTHNPAGFYRFFPPDEAQAYLDRFEFHYAPKKGSWLKACLRIKPSDSNADRPFTAHPLHRRKQRSAMAIALSRPSPRGCPALGRTATVSTGYASLRTTTTRLVLPSFPATGTDHSRV